MQIGLVEVLCSDTIHAGIPITIKSMTDSLEMFAVEQLACADYSMIVDRQMTAAHTSHQFGVSVKCV